ncbi:hypothetical protein Tsp_14486 [Trichinella spiralis]|uniref:hypothetical protein n=1 Tax=Trichinella spiralis TaxID=6334 RepID=UPI0001EFEDBE|nr:hypothetical protein Tsp_14486 [Trichinella spiralis]
MPRCNLLSVKTGSKTIAITSSAEFLWRFICSGHREKSCSHHFVLNLASQTSKEWIVIVADFAELVEQRSYKPRQRIVACCCQCVSNLWITSSHESCTVCNPCSHGRKGAS